MAIPWLDVGEFSFLSLSFLWGALVLTRTVEQGLASLCEAVDIDSDARSDSERVSRQKVLELMERIRAVLGSVLNTRQEPVADLCGFLMRETRKSLWGGQTYIPDEILVPLSELLESIDRVANLSGSDRKEHGESLRKIRDDYAHLVSKVRETYYVPSEQAG